MEDNNNNQCLLSNLTHNSQHNTRVDRLNHSSQASRRANSQVSLQAILVNPKANQVSLQAILVNPQASQASQQANLLNPQASQVSHQLNLEAHLNRDHHLAQRLLVQELRVNPLNRQQLHLNHQVYRQVRVSLNQRQRLHAHRLLRLSPKLHHQGPHLSHQLQCQAYLQLHHPDLL